MIRLGRTESGIQPTLRLDAPLVVLRPPAPEDWRVWSQLRAESRSFLTPWEPTWPADALSQGTYLRRLKRQATEWRLDEGYSFHIFSRAPETLVGGIGLTQVRRGVAQTGTVGYWIGERFARRGYTSAAVDRLLRFAFETLDLHRVEAACVPENIASRGVLERCGFMREGYARGYLRIAGDWRDHLLFAILREDFESRGRPS